MENDVKAFNIRLPKEIWAFVKHKAIERDTSMNDLIISLIEIYKKKYDIKVAKKY